MNLRIINKIETKTCGICKITKAQNEFFRNGNRHQSYCKECAKEKIKKYRQENKEKIRITSKKYLEKNREKHKEHSRNYIERHKSEVNERKSIYRHKNREILNEKAREYISKNRELLKKKSREYLKNNKEKVNKYQKKYYEDNKEKRKEYGKEYYEKNKDIIKEYRERNNEIIKRQRKNYRKSNKEELNEKRKERIKNDPVFALTCTIRSLIYSSFRKFGYKKTSRTCQILGCTFEEFKNYIESQFEDWMTWENHGKYNSEINYGWDLDHIVPISSAKTIEDVINLNHYTNLQPLCGKINRHIKRDYYENEREHHLPLIS